MKYLLYNCLSCIFCWLISVFTMLLAFYFVYEHELLLASIMIIIEIISGRMTKEFGERVKELKL